MNDADRPPAARLDWGTGQYEVTALELEPVARRIMELAQIVPGERALDLACGTGNAALLAAKAGAQVTGLDASERLLSVAGARATIENVDVQWQIGDLHELPFADGSFELVSSVFGIIFASDPQRAIAEIVRVLSPGGRALLTTWIPRGGLDAAVGIAGRAVNAALSRAPAQRFAWADQTAVSGIVARAGGRASFAEGELVFTGLSPQSYYDEVQAVHPMSVAARPLLEQAGTYDEVRAQIIAALAAHNEDPSGLRLTSPYLIVEIRPATTA